VRTDVYLVPFDGLKQLAGSKDRHALATIREEQAGILADADGLLAADATATCADALAELIDGKDFGAGASPRNLFRYRFALEAIWAHLGQYAGEVWCETADDLDDVFAELGVPLTFTALVGGDSVVAIPVWDDLPCVGAWSPEQAVAALPAVEAIDPDDLEVDDELGEGTAVLLDAIKDAAGRPGWGVVAISF